MGSDSNTIIANISGILIEGDGTVGNRVEGNWIGTNSAGSSSVGNNADGVVIRNGAKRNTIVDNTIRNNVGQAILVEGIASTGNTLSRNVIADNGRQNAILVDPPIVTPPEVSFAYYDASAGVSATRISLEFVGIPNATYAIEVFRNQVSPNFNPFMDREAQQYLGAFTLTLDAAGVATVRDEAIPSSDTTSSYVSVIATLMSGGAPGQNGTSSELSSNQLVTSEFTVTNATGDQFDASGNWLPAAPGSLRDIVSRVNAAGSRPGPIPISFYISARQSLTIPIGTQDPTYERVSPVRITRSVILDGRNTHPDLAGLVQIVGPGCDLDGLVLQADGSLIRNVVVYNFHDAIVVEGDGNTVADSFVGILPSGNNCAGQLQCRHSN